MCFSAMYIILKSDKIYHLLKTVSLSFFLLVYYFWFLKVGCAHCWLYLFGFWRGGEVIWKKLKGTLCCFIEGKAKMESDSLLDYAVFQLSPKRTRWVGGYIFSFVWKCTMNALIVMVFLDLLGQMRIVCFSWWKHGETSIRIVEAFCDPFENCRRASCIGCSIY